MSRLIVRNTTVYIAGKISDEPSYLAAYDKFHRYEHYYSVQDFEVTNPMKICRANWSWWRCMAKCLAALSKCRLVAFMPDWLQSRGARIEMIAALILGKSIVFAKEI